MLSPIVILLKDKHGTWQHSFPEAKQAEVLTTRLPWAFGGRSDVLVQRLLSPQHPHWSLEQGIEEIGMKMHSLKVFLQHCSLIGIYVLEWKLHQITSSFDSVVNNSDILAG